MRMNALPTELLEIQWQARVQCGFLIQAASHSNSLLSVERCVTSQKTAAKETNRVTVCRGFESHLGLAFFRVSSGLYRNIISCNKYEERHKELASICSLIFFFRY